MLNMEQRIVLQERVKILFVKSFFFVKNYCTITCERLIKVFVYQNVAHLIFYKKKKFIYFFSFQNLL